MDDDKEMMIKLIRDLLEDKKNTLEMLNVIKTYFSALVQKGWCLHLQSSSKIAIAICDMKFSSIEWVIISILHFRPWE